MDVALKKILKYHVIVPRYISEWFYIIFNDNITMINPLGFAFVVI